MTTYNFKAYSLYCALETQLNEGLRENNYGKFRHANYCNTYQDTLMYMYVYTCTVKYRQSAPTHVTTPLNFLSAPTHVTTPLNFYVSNIRLSAWLSVGGSWPLPLPLPCIPG